MREVQLTLAEASEILHPPMTERQLRDILRALRWPPSGYRHDGRPGHPRAVYEWRDLCELHAALAPFLAPP